MDNIRIATPCPATWERMAGDERVRHCTLCNLNVYNFKEMTRDEINALLVKSEGRVCARLYRRADGTLLTSDCPTGLQVLRRRVSRFAAAVAAALFSVSAFAGTGGDKPRFWRKGSTVKIQIQRPEGSQQAAFQGVVREHQTGAPLPGVTVVLRNTITKRESMTVTDVNGRFTIATPEAGFYRIEALLVGFRPAILDKVALNGDDVVTADIVLRIDTSLEMITVGAIAVDLVPKHTISTTMYQDLVNKLPL